MLIILPAFLDKMTIIDVDSSDDSFVAPRRNKELSRDSEKLVKFSRSELLLIKNRNVKCSSDFNLKVRERHPDIADIILRTENHDESKVDKDNKFWEIEKQKEWDDEILDLLRNVPTLSNDDQIMSLVNMLRGPRQRMELISSLVSDIESCLKREFPHCSIIPYGSTSTGFAFQDSDLDAFVDLQLKSLTSVGKSTDEEENRGRHTRTSLVAEYLRKEERFRSAHPILHARIPIVKMRDRVTGIKCDINVVCNMGVKNSEFLNYCRSLDTRCEYLVSVVKYIAIRQGMVGSGPGDHLNSYTVVLMVIFFLQVGGILPSVEILQTGVKADVINGWNCAFDKDFDLNEWKEINSPNQEGSISKLLKDFFKFYICFPYDTHIICPLLGSPVKKYNLKLGYNLPRSLQKAPHFGKKKEKLEVNKSLVIQDPFELTRNVAVGISKAHFSKFNYNS